MKNDGCNGHHDDKLNDTYTDSAGRPWDEYECKQCHRLRRQRS